MSLRRELTPGMTKQGVRDLNHIVPKAAPVTMEVPAPAAEDTSGSVAPVATTSIEP